MRQLVAESEIEIDLDDPAASVDSQALPTDERLMQRLAAGDSQAMHRLLEQHGPMLGRFVGRLTAWHADQEDILQEVLLKVWQQAGSYRGGGSLEGWLKRIALNQCRNHFRALATWKRKLEQLAEQVALMGSGESREPVLSFEGIDPELKQALEQLSRSDRETVVLFYLEEMKGEEIADLMNIRTETLHVRLHRARQRLKQILEQNPTS